MCFQDHAFVLWRYVEAERAGRIYSPLLNTFVPERDHFSPFAWLPRSMSSSAPFHAHPFLPLPGNRVRDSVTL